MDTIRYENCYAASEVSKQMVPSDWTNVEWTNKIKVYLKSETDVTAKDLLSMFLPFGYVISVQKIVKDGHKHGMVHYSTADEAAVALSEMRTSTKVFLVAQVGIREVREARKNKRSESPDQPPSLPQGSLSYKLPWRLPSVWNPLFPACSQTVSVEIDNLPKSMYERNQVLSLLPPSTMNVKVIKRRACVVLPDFSTALWLMDLLQDFNAASQRLRVSFAPQG